ncbi:hypothetical protein C1752_17740 [Acaryochloris thomasi RCC1774]|uniref:Filamentous haemagglutinin FhaB/tRNA nuclease CdiA-like TPS domain-containing protein n=1 Tax=Acaryochloris thomasi RCC1774 TaxID=1764569 RepID=A0A2W1J7G8_9CYAN|nr:S-layer family protein [Acaryochloris thomasi]PZD70146.1 hypothetical protein C1752_17740 [Acaryochloris thomasi RCC1774]
MLLVQSFGDRPSGDIQVKAIEKLNLLNIAEDGRFSGPVITAIVENQDDARIASTFLTDNLGNSTGGDIIIKTKSLNLINGGQISTRTFLAGQAGDIIIDASNELNVLDFSPEFPIFFSNISSATFSSGASGEVSISTDQLLVTNGGVIGSATFGPGSGGSVNILATDIRLAGILPFFLFPSSINAATFGPGDAGELTINANTLSLFDSSRIGTSTVGTGNAGTVNIDTSESIFISGSNPISPNPSLIDSSASITGPTFEDQLGALPVPLGNAGGLNISTKNLSVVDGALISVNNDGLGNAGNINLEADFLKLSSRGEISASTESGNGGNIRLQSELLSLDDSIISASAKGLGLGGNVAINSSLIVGIGESRISANAEQSVGGRIRIDTLSVFGENLTITATSDLGSQFDGQVEIDVEDRPVLVDQVEIQQPRTNTVKLACSPDSSSGQSSFSMQSSGGLAAQPRNFSQTLPIASKKAAEPQLSFSAPFIVDKESGKKVFLVEPSGFHRQSDGTRCLGYIGTENNAKAVTL